MLLVPIPWPVRLHATHKIFPKLFLGYEGLIDAIKFFFPHGIFILFLPALPKGR